MGDSRLSPGENGQPVYVDMSPKHYQMLFSVGMLPGSWRLRNELGVESLFKESYCSRKISPLSGSENDSDSTRKTLSWEWLGRTSGNCWRGRRGVVVGGNSSGGGICNLMLQPAGLHSTLADVSCFGHAVLW